MEQFINYLKDTVAELKHVSWPTHKQATVLTVLVIVLSAVIALYMGIFDFILQRGLNWFIK